MRVPTRSERGAVLRLQLWRTAVRSVRRTLLRIHGRRRAHVLPKRLTKRPSRRPLRAALTSTAPRTALRSVTSTFAAAVVGTSRPSTSDGKLSVLGKVPTAADAHTAAPHRRHTPCSSERPNTAPTVSCGWNGAQDLRGRMLGRQPCAVSPGEGPVPPPVRRRQTPGTGRALPGPPIRPCAARDPHKLRSHPFSRAPLSRSRRQALSAWRRAADAFPSGASPSRGRRPSSPSPRVGPMPSGAASPGRQSRYRVAVRPPAYRPCYRAPRRSGCLRAP